MELRVYVCVCVCVYSGKGLEEPQPQPMGLRGPMLCPQIAPSGAQTGMHTEEILMVSPYTSVPWHPARSPHLPGALTRALCAASRSRGHRQVLAGPRSEPALYSHWLWLLPGCRAGH